MDEPLQTVQALNTWEDLCWGHLTLGPTGYIDDAAPTHPPGGFAWGTDGANTASITFQYPMRVAIHAELMIPEPAATT